MDDRPFNYWIAVYWKRLRSGKENQPIGAPPAVESTVESHSRGGRVERLSLERANGEIYYKAKMKVDGHRKDVVINPTGDVERVQEQVALDSLPENVKAGIKAKSGFLGRVASVESIKKRDKVVAYEAEVEKPIFFVPGATVTKSTVQVDPDGKPLKRKE
jgi:hypothetical protein